MSHFAKLNSDNIVTQIIVAEQDFINSGIVGDAFLWIQTSYNGNFRGKYAVIGDTWDKVNEVFISPQPYPSWTISAGFTWNAPTPPPADDKIYTWDEDTTAWVETV
tara:strand:+ start:1287 stop:1604 length:318 start_codon:yes stop_codon:yes gene_type:complete